MQIILDQISSYGTSSHRHYFIKLAVELQLMKSHHQCVSRDLHFNPRNGLFLQVMSIFVKRI